MTVTQCFIAFVATFISAVVFALMMAVAPNRSQCDGGATPSTIATVRTAELVADAEHDALRINDVLKQEDRVAFDNLQRWRDSGYEESFDEAVWARMRHLLTREAQIARADSIYWSAKLR